MYPPGYTTGDEDDTADYLDRRSKPESLPTHESKHMGDMADMINDDTMDMWNYEDASDVPEGYWMMRDGRLIKISKMTDAHLHNAIKLFENRCMNDLIEPLIEEQERRLAKAKKAKEWLMERDPLYVAFRAGWLAGYRSCDMECNPEVGFSIPKTFEQAWKEFNKPQKVKFNLPEGERLNESLPPSYHEKKKNSNRRD